MLSLKEQAAKRIGGIRGLLFAMTAAFVLLAELLIFPPSAANMRNQFLRERIQAAEIAAFALDASPDRMLSDELARRLADETDLIAVAIGQDGMRELIFGPQTAITGPIETIDLRDQMFVSSIWNTFGHMFAPRGRLLRVIDNPKMAQDGYVDILMAEDPLNNALWRYSGNILLLSLLIPG